MRLLDHKLYLTIADLVDCGVSEGYLWTARSKGIKSLRFIDDPEDNRKVLVEYEALTQKYKDLVIARFGNPYDHVTRNPIRQLVQRDLEAERYFLSYKFEQGQSLPIETVKKYSTTCDWLNLLIRVEKDKSIAKKQLNISLASFYSHVTEIIKADNISLPTTYQRLRNRIIEYQKGGYDSVIEKWRFNNNYAAKVNDELSQAVLLELIADNSQHDDVIIARTYNKWASQNGYQAITEQTVGNWRRNNEVGTMLYRDGNKAHYNKYGKHILRKRPSAPLLLVGGDGNDWDMFFRSERNNQVYYFDKYVLVVVMDAFNDYILGWSIGKEENKLIIQAAYVDALQHIFELTGSFYLPHQLQTDRFALASLKDFYGKMVDDYFPAAAKSPRGKYIERSYGTQWHQTLKQYKNWSGHNITAKKKINTDRIELEKRNFPHTSEAFIYAQDFISQLRNLKNAEGLTKQAQWLAAFEASPISRQRAITYEQYLANFGILNNYTQTINNRGLLMQINNRELVYDIPDEYYLQVVGKKVQVMYDPYNYESVLVCSDNFRFIASVPYLLPSATADFQPGDKERLWKRLHLKKQHMETIAAAKQQREQVLTENAVNPGALLQAGVLVKELKQQAEIGYRDQEFRIPTALSKPTHYDPLDQL